MGNRFNRASVELVYSPDDNGYYWSRWTGIKSQTSTAIYPDGESARKALSDNRVEWES